MKKVAAEFNGNGLRNNEVHRMGWNNYVIHLFFSLGGEGGQLLVFKPNIVFQAFPIINMFGYRLFEVINII